MSLFYNNFTIPALWAFTCAGLLWYFSRAAVQIRYVTLADGQRQIRKLPLFIQLLLPLTPNITPFLGGASLSASREKLDRKITSAGLDGVISAKEFQALKLLCPLVFGPLVIVLLHLLFQRLPGGLGAKLADRVLWFDLAALLLAFAYPGVWLQGEKTQRHRRIEHALPFVLDLLTLSVEAGMDFMTAIQRIVQRRKMDPLSEELLLTFREVQLGKTRREALRNMGTQVGPL